MFNWHGFPWTDFEELNLDWVLRHIKSIETDAIPNLDQKIADVYNFIKENLSEIVTSLTSVIIDVTLYGAVGDGVTDSTDAIKASLDAGDILYFPPGSYCFKEVAVNKNIIIFGEGETSILIPIRKHATTNQFFTMFDFHGDAVISNLKLWADNSVTTQTGVKMFNDAAFNARDIDYIVFDHVIFDHIFETYHENLSDTVFEERTGMAVTCRDCEHVVFHSCEVREFGGEELIYITRGRPDYGGGLVTITNCYLHDRHSGDKGSALVVQGGTLIFTDNNIEDFDNLYTGETDGGSILNLCGAYSIIANNYFQNCVAGNYFDITEGYYQKAEVAIVTGNVLNGSTKSPIHAMARRLFFTNNFVRSCMGVRVHCMTNELASTLKYNGVYCVDPTTKFTFESATFKDNTFFTTATPYGSAPSGSYETAIAINVHPADQDPTLPRLVISGNDFTRINTSSCKNTIYHQGKISRAFINDNTFSNTGVSYPTAGGSTNKAFISGDATASYMNIINNIFDTSTDATAGAYFLYSGTDNARTSTYFIFANNVSIKSHATSTPPPVYNYYLSNSYPAAAHVIENNNINSTSHQ